MSHFFFNSFAYEADFLQKERFLVAALLFLAINKLKRYTMKPSVYIIEDDEDSQNLLTMALRKAGFDVSASGNGYPVLEMTNHWPDIFILDVDLPGVNGIDVCKWLKSHNQSKYIPVIFVSAANSLQYLSEHAKGDDFLQKPFQIQTLIQKINSCLAA